MEEPGPQATQATVGTDTAQKPAGRPCPAGGAISGSPVAPWLCPYHLGIQAELESQGHPPIPGEELGLLNAVE